MSTSEQKNLVFITSHDTGRHLGCYGQESVRTPNIDRLASEGVRFTNHFAASTYCSPSRGAIMTGRYPQNNGMMGLCHGMYRWRLNEGERHISEILHDQGYYTALIGHQHETVDIDRDLVFDFHGFHSDEVNGGHLPCDGVVQGVDSFLREEAGAKAPFFLQVGFFETHHPFAFGGATPDDEAGVVVPPWIRDDEEARGVFAAYQGNIHKMDWAVGEILKSLDEAGLADETLVVYTTDHGIPFPRAKATLYERGMETALVMRLPGVLGSGAEFHALMSNVDDLPTVLDLIGVEIPDNLDGMSMAPVLREGAGTSVDGGPRAFVHGMLTRHTSNCEHRSVRNARYKLLWNCEYGFEVPVPVPVHGYETGPGKKSPPIRPIAELYDLENDWLEANNLAEDPAYAEIRDELEAELHRWLAAVDDPILEAPTPSPFYVEAMETLNAGRGG